MLPGGSIRCAICNEYVFLSEEFGTGRCSVFPCENCRTKTGEEYRQEIAKLEEQLRAKKTYKIERVKWDIIISKSTN
jgi:hypothetical protein